MVPFIRVYPRLWSRLPAFTARKRVYKRVYPRGFGRVYPRLCSVYVPFTRVYPRKRAYKRVYRQDPFAYHY